MKNILLREFSRRYKEIDKGLRQNQQPSNL